MAAKTRKDRHDFKPDDKLAARSEMSLAIVQDGSVISVLGPLPYRKASLAPSVLPLNEPEGFKRWLAGVCQVEQAESSADPERAMQAGVDAIRASIDTLRAIRTVNHDDKEPTKAESLQKLDNGAAAEYSAAEITPAENPDLEPANRFLNAIEVVAAQTDLPQNVRDAVVLSLKKSMIGETAPGPDLSAWKPSEQYAARPRRPDLGRKENVVEFLQRVWSPVIASGELPLAKLKQEDAQGYTALFNWKREHGFPGALPLVSLRDTAAVRIKQEASLPPGLKSANTKAILEYRQRRDRHLQLQKMNP